jgi:SAM-dependent methyltransferase
VLQENTAGFRDRITYLKSTGDQLRTDDALDYVFVIGVLHHIPDPDSVVAAAFRALRSGGKLAVWLYGREGTGLYLALVRPLWWLTRRLPHRGLDLFVRLIYPLFWRYMTACR